MVSLFKLNVRYPIFDQKIIIFWGIYDIRRKKDSAILRHSFVSRFEKKTFFENSSHFHCWSLDTLLKQSVNL